MFNVIACVYLKILFYQAFAICLYNESRFSSTDHGRKHDVD